MDIVDLFLPDATKYLDDEEEKVLKKIEKKNYILVNKIKNVKVLKLLRDLIPSGIVCRCDVGSNIYYYIPDKKNTIIRTFFFFYPKKNIGKIKDTEKLLTINREDIKLFSYGKKFLSDWVSFGKRVKPEKYCEIISLHSFRMPYVISFPDFLMNKFLKQVEKFSLKYDEVFLEKLKVVCCFCDKNFGIIESDKTIICPHCNKENTVN